MVSCVRFRGAQVEDGEVGKASAAYAPERASSVHSPRGDDQTTPLLVAQLQELRQAFHASQVMRGVSVCVTQSDGLAEALTLNVFGVCA